MPSMTPDRATLNFLNSFADEDRREGELLQKDGAVTQIFGNSVFIRGQVEVSKVYRAGLYLRNGEWEGEVTPDDRNSGAALVATMLERIQRGEALPESPNEIGEHSLATLLEDKLERALNVREEQFVEKLEKRYRRFEVEGHIRDTDLVRLNPKWEVSSLEPLELWPTPPKNILEFWNRIAHAFHKNNVSIPSFMEVLTDRESTASEVRQWEEEQDLQLWQNRLKAFGDRRNDGEIRELELRLIVSVSDARLQWRHTGGQWQALASGQQLEELERGIHGGHLRPGALAALLFAQFHDYCMEEETDYLDLDKAAACRLVNRLFHQAGMGDLLLTLDEKSFSWLPWELGWECRECVDGSGDYELVLLTSQGEEIPHSVRMLPGAEPLYLADEVIFRGPPQWNESTEVLSRYEIPVGVVENSEGIDFLMRIDATLPPSLKAKVRETRMQGHLHISITRNLTTANSEHLIVKVSAVDPHSGRCELLKREGWMVENAGTSPGMDILRYDRTQLDRMPLLLEEMSLVFDVGLQAHKTRITKLLPERFVEWVEQLPSGIQIEADELVQSLLADPVSATIRFEVDQQDIDWFDLRIVVNVEGADLSQEQIRALVAARGGFVRLKEGKWMRLRIDLDDEQREAVQRLGIDPFDMSGEKHRMHAFQLSDPAVREAFDPDAWNRICDRAAQLQVAVKPATPVGLKASLRPYQVEGFHFLAYLTSNRFGGILADDMGLGKTVQSLTWLLWLRENSLHPAPSLVVCPKSVLDVWAGEAERFTPETRVHVFRAGDDLDPELIHRDVDLLVLNYAQLRIHGDALKSINWLAVILDEGQQIKNPDSKAAKTARVLKAENRLVLTGTPIENRLLDLWSLMAFAMPGVLGNRSYFTKRFDRRKDDKAQDRLSARLRPFLIRRTKQQVATDLPSRTEEDVFCNMEGVQKELYEAELKRIQNVLLGLEQNSDIQKNSFIILQGLMRLRQICCHPGLIDESHMDAESAKMNALFYLLDQLHEEGHKVLVFSQFVTMLDIIRTRLEKEKRPFSYLTGQTNNRREVIDHFQRTQDPNVFLLSLKAGGSGLNLTSASYVILYDPWWNPAVENQAIDRTHRIGQTQKVIAYRLLMRDSVEQKIRVLQHQKQDLFTGVLGQESFTSTLAIEDLQYLFEQDPAEPSAYEKRKKKAGLVIDV